VDASFRNLSPPTIPGIPPLDVLLDMSSVNLDRTYRFGEYIKLIAPAYSTPIQHAILAGESERSARQLAGMATFLEDTDQV
jgi:hypothetical protein